MTTTPVPTRFSDDELAMIDRLVTDGIGKHRSDVIRQAVRHLDEITRRAGVGRAIAESYRDQPQTTEDDLVAAANAVAMADAEPW